MYKYEVSRLYDFESLWLRTGKHLKRKKGVLFLYIITNVLMTLFDLIIS